MTNNTLIPSCPNCGSYALLCVDTCHTWKGQSDQWMSCYACFSALRYSCGNNGCHWHYTHGLNPDNPRFPQNEERRPNWLPQKYEEGFIPHGFEMDPWGTWETPEYREWRELND